VDIQNYAAWFRSRTGTEAIAVNGGPPPLGRRAVIQASAPAPAEAAPPAQSGEADAAPESPYDVPAFLRRQREG
jgi:hypothetical protein